jgi:hypothetical protein
MRRQTLFFVCAGRDLAGSRGEWADVAAKSATTTELEGQVVRKMRKLEVEREGEREKFRERRRV